MSDISEPQDFEIIFSKHLKVSVIFVKSFGIYSFTTLYYRFIAWFTLAKHFEEHVVPDVV